MEKNKSLKILYIEDDPASRLLVRKILMPPEFEYLEAPNGLSGLKLAQKEHPDLILMDINLPDVSGNELTTKIKNTEALKDIVVVALTGLKDKLHRDLTLIAGCDGYLSKPIDVGEFPRQIKEFYEGKREQVDGDFKDYYHSRYEVSLVERLTGKVQELQGTNRKLSQTFHRLQLYNVYLEHNVAIMSDLQTAASSKDLKKKLVDSIYERLKYDRCVFMDVDPEDGMMRINYARGIKSGDWQKYNYPYNNALFQQLFEKRRVLFMPNVERIRDAALRHLLKEWGSRQFLFAYLGAPKKPFFPVNIREMVMDTFLPSLYDQKDYDVDIILENLQEYLANESLYRAGFVFMDNAYTHRRIASYEYRFLETLFRTTGYMFQNLLLMEHLRFLFVRAEKEAVTDALTNLYNFRYFIQQVNREISRDTRHKSSFSLIMIDIDFFKVYNDAFGHQAGDVILRKIAREMLTNTRNSDIVARYGGEEFVIICPELNKEGACRMAEKLRRIVEQMNFPHKKELPEQKLTISLGVATFPQDGESAYRLIRSADKALYRAKNAGRNRVCAVGKQL